MKFQIRNALFLLTTLFFASLSFASGFPSAEQCAAIFLDAELKNEIKSSEAQRSLMLGYVQKVQLEIRLQMKTRLAAFDRSVRIGNNLREADIERIIKTSPTLSRFDLPPFESGPISGRIKPPLIDLEKPVEVGYFEWLKHNSLEFNLVDQGEMFQDGSYRPTVRQVEPLDLLRRYVEEGFSLDLSVKLVQAKLDPTLPNEAREAALYLRHLVSLDKAIDQQILPYLETRFSVGAAHEAWRLFTSLPEARSNLRRLLDSQVEKHGSRFARNDFERLVLALSEKPGYFNPMVRFLALSARGELGASELAALAGYLGEMKAVLKLNPKMELGDLSMILNSLLPNPVGHSYESILAVTFSPKGSVIPDQVMALQKLIEIAESLKTHKSTVDYVESLVPKPRTP